MSPVLSTLAVMIPGFVHLGRVQLPVFGIVATAGLVAALLLSQRTARLAGLEPDRLWDAGVVAVVSAFAVSRLLLTAVNLRLFLAHPLLVLAQPSLSAGGLAVTALIVWLWLRRHRLPLLRVLDAWAPAGALLAASLQLGHFAEGTDAGMPTSLPWGVHGGGDLLFAHVHPVQLYLAAAYLALCALLYRGLRKAHPPGSAFRTGLIVGGGFAFFAGFLRQPYDASGPAWLDPGQYVALLAVVLGLIPWHSLPQATAAAFAARPLTPLLADEEPS